MHNATTTKDAIQFLELGETVEVIVPVQLPDAYGLRFLKQWDPEKADEYDVGIMEFQAEQAHDRWLVILSAHGNQLILRVWQSDELTDELLDSAPSEVLQFLAGDLLGTETFQPLESWVFADPLLREGIVCAGFLRLLGKLARNDSDAAARWRNASLSYRHIYAVNGAEEITLWLPAGDAMDHLKALAARRSS